VRRSCPLLRARRRRRVGWVTRGSAWRRGITALRDLCGRRLERDDGASPQPQEHPRVSEPSRTGRTSERVARSTVNFNTLVRHAASGPSRCVAAVPLCLPEDFLGPRAPPEPPPVPPGVLVRLQDAPEDSAAFDVALSAVLQQRDSATVAKRWLSIGGAWMVGRSPDEHRRLLEEGRLASLDRRHDNRMGDDAGGASTVFDTGIMTSNT